MGVQQDLMDAVEEGRDEVVRVLAAYRVLPETVAVETSGSNLLGGSRTPDFAFERQSESESEHVADRQTRARIVDALGLQSEDDCDAVRDEIRSHDAWGERA